jgi:hypothetical protein
MMRKSLIAAMAISTQLFAGGFGLQLGNPEASPEARSMNAVLTVKSAGCAAAEKTTVTGTAIGIVNGKRHQIPLKISPLAEPGFFAITQQWPKEGKWVIQLVGENNNVYTGSLVSADSAGVDRLHAKQVRGRPTPEEVDSMLGATALAKK